jgi:hypothetical protein
MKLKLLVIVSLSIVLVTIMGCSESKSYNVTILSAEEYKETNLGDSIVNCNQENGYYKLIESDSDNLEMYVYIYNYNKELHYTTYNATLDIDNNNNIVIDINSEDAFNDSEVMKDILLHVSAPTSETCYTLSEVNVDGVNYNLLESSHLE